MKSYDTARPHFVNDFRREQEAVVVPWQTDTRAAAAVPIHYRKRVIGAIEVQSSVMNIFSPQALETVALLAAQMAPDIEDRWLLESGWLTQQVRECLRNLGDEAYLHHCALADWLQISDLARRSELLRRILRDAIEHTVPEAAAPDSRITRRYQILKQTYVDQLAAEIVCQNLGLSRRQYFYDLKQAVDVVVDFLYVQRQQISLRYDAPLASQ